MEVALNSVVASSPASYSSSTSSLDCTLLSTTLLDGNSVQGSNQNKQNCLFSDETAILDSSIFQNALNLNKNQNDSTTTITTTTTTTSKSNNNSISNNKNKNKSNSNKTNINNHDFNQTQNIYQHLQKSPLQKKQQMESQSKTEINATLSSTTSLTRAIETLNNQTSSTMLTETLIFNYTCDYDKNSGNNSIGNKVDLTNFGTNSSLSPASLQSSATLAVINGTSSNTTNNLYSILTKLNSSQCTTAQTAITIGSSSDTELTLSNTTAGISLHENNVKTTTNCDSLLAIAAASLPNTSIPINNAKATKSSTSLSSSVGQTSSIPNGNCNNVNGNGLTNGKTNIIFKIPSDILDDLASRFIINVPDMELNNLIRVCFQIELAHWFYLDFFCASEDEEVKLQPIGIKQFAMQIFQHIPFLQSHLPSVEKVLEEWKHYKMAVPTFGAILISEDLKYCLLVQSYFAKSSWGFPKGKVNENEDPVHCATREVYEETSFDITNLIVPNDYIEAVINYQYTRLYIVQNVPLATKFMPRTRNEIKCCDWFPIDSLPINKMDAISKTKLGLNANSFFMILPFMKRLKKWVNDRRAGIEPVIRRKCSGIPALTMGHNGVSISPPLSKSPPNAFNNKNNNNINGNNSSNNQKFSNGNNSSKKNKQYQYRNNSDEKYALYNSNITDNDKDISGCGEGAAAVLLDISNNKGKNTLNGNMAGNGVGNGQFGDKNNCLNNLSTTIMTNTNPTTPNNNNNTNQRSKRQRHKSMGDLDGIKLTNLNSNNNTNNLKNNQSNYNTNDDVNNANSVTATAPNAVVNTNKFYNNSNNNASGGPGNYKRNAIKIGAAGSNSNNVNNNGNNNQNSKNGSNTNGLGNSSTKRQLFHSQSQNGTSSHQQQNGEKNGNSFDNVRKEKQQFQKTKVQKQQQQNSLNNSFSGGGRVRAKSQSENQQMLQKSKSGVNNNAMNKNRLQRQKSLTYTSSAFANCTKISNKNLKNSNNVKDNNDFKSTKTKVSTGANPPNHNEKQHAIQQSRSFTGMDLIALMEKSGATGSLTPVKGENLNSITTVAQIERECRPRPRPVSVSLHFENNNSHNNTKLPHQILNGLIKNEALEAKAKTRTISSSATTITCEQEQESKENKINIKKEPEEEQQTIPLKRYPSGSNLRSLRRFLSQQPQSSLSTSSSTSAESSTSSCNSSAKNASITDILDLRRPNNSTSDGGDAETTLKPFSPNNSWRNFAFTKNFISNVFC